MRTIQKNIADFARPEMTFDAEKMAKEFDERWSDVVKYKSLFVEHEHALQRAYALGVKETQEKWHKAGYEDGRRFRNRL